MWRIFVFFAVALILLPYATMFVSQALGAAFGVIPFAPWLFDIVRNLIAFLVFPLSWLGFWTWVAIRSARPRPSEPER